MSDLSIFANPQVAQLLQGLVHGSQGMAPQVPQADASSFAPGANPAMSGFPMGQSAFAPVAGNPGMVPTVASPDLRPMASGPIPGAVMPSPTDPGGAMPSYNGEYVFDGATSGAGPMPGPYDPNDPFHFATAAARGFGLTPADPTLREQAGALAEDAYNTPNPPPKGVAWRTADLIAALPAILMGASAPQYLGGLIGGKMGFTQDQNAYETGEAERMRSGQMSRANALYSAANTQDLVNGRQETALESTRRALGIADARNSGNLAVAKIRGAFTLQGVQEKADAARTAASLASSDRRLSTLVKQATGSVPAERGIAMNALRDEYPDLYGDTTDAEIKSAVAATAKETRDMEAAGELKAKADDLRKHAGYMGALTDKVKKMTPVEIDQKRASIGKLKAETRAAISRIGLNEANVNLIQKKADNYMNEYRLKYSVAQARLAKLSEKSEFSSADLSSARELYNSQANIARRQITAILKMTDQEPPDHESPHYTAYAQAVQDEKEALDQLQGLNAYAGSMGHTTSGYGGGNGANPMTPDLMGVIGKGTNGMMGGPSTPVSNAVSYVGGNNPNNMVTINGVSRSIAQHVQNANAAIAAGKMTRSQVLEIFRKANVTAR